ncbi:MAG: amidohydrolase family protein [Planctomycetes bacterium]|nr:amidohydrolase family protein [Planctomycetota bacterium]
MSASRDDAASHAADDPRRAPPVLVVPRALLCTPERWIEGGALLVAAGRIVEVVASPRRRVRLAARSVRRVELADAVVTPGFVNAHAHLELSGLRGRTARGASFSAWIGSVLRARGSLGADEWNAAWSLGAQRALATGTTLVADIDSTGAWSRARGPRPRLLVLRELLDAFDARRTPSVLEHLHAPGPRRARTSNGLSPHAPHTVGNTLLDAIARFAARHATRLGVHWAETPEEGDWLERGTGPFAALLGASPRQRGLARLAERGLLNERATLYHGNAARPFELDELARARATLVHCPGTHAFFGREPVDVPGWLGRGVRVALGTDSLASNDDLDLALELARLRSAYPALPPARAWELATLGGARALGAEGRAGELRAGAWADFAVWSIDRVEHAAALEALTTRAATLRSVWLAGRPVDLGLAGAAW